MKIALLADEDTISGFLLAGAGESKPQTGDTFLVVNNSTKVHTVEEQFSKMTQRSDIAMVVMTQTVANMIRPTLTSYEKIIPTVVEIPTKTEPWDPNTDSIINRVRVFLGAGVDKILSGEVEEVAA